MKISGKRKRSKITNSCIYTIQEFGRILEYEKLRSNRSGIHFSFITLAIDQSAVSKKTAKSILSEILINLRVIDHVGWVDGDKIGILLPGTNEEGARGFLAKIRNQVPITDTVIIKNIMTFPLPEYLMSSVSASSIRNESMEIPEAEEVSVIPFDKSLRYG